MLAALPAISLILLLLITLTRPHQDWRGAVLQSAIIWGLALTVITEVLSLFHALTVGWVAGAWVVFSAALVWLCRSMRATTTGLQRLLDTNSLAWLVV